MTLQGLPNARELGGMSLVTTLPAPMTEPSPIVTPGRTTTFAAIQTLSSITIGLAEALSDLKPYLLPFSFVIGREDMTGLNLLDLPECIKGTYEIKVRAQIYQVEFGIYINA